MSISVNIGGLVPSVFKASLNIEIVDLSCDDAPVVLDGVELVDTICPINKATGLRESFSSAIERLKSDPVKGRLLDKVLSDLPVIGSNSSLSVDDKLSALMPVLETGTPADNDAFLSNLELTLSSYLTSPKSPVVVDKSDGVDVKSPSDVINDV